MPAAQIVLHQSTYEWLCGGCETKVTVTRGGERAQLGSVECPTCGAPMLVLRVYRHVEALLDDLKATIQELAGMGALVAVYDPECGEDRYCTPEFSRAHDSRHEGTEPQDVQEASV